MDPARFHRTTVELAREAADGALALPAVLELLDLHIGADALSTMDLSRRAAGEGAVRVRGGPPLTVEETRLWTDLLPTHPFIHHLRHGPWAASRVTDVVPLASLKRLEVYQRLLRPRASLFQAAIVLRRHDTGRLTVASLWRADRDFTDLEMHLAERARRPLAAALAYRDELDAMGVPRGPEPVTSGPAGADDGALTYRQAQVAALVALGLTNEQIAHRLGISPRTVRKHLEDARARTASVSRAGLAAWWGGRSATLAP